MEALRTAASGSAAGRGLLAVLDELQLSEDKLGRLSAAITGFARTAGQGPSSAETAGVQPEEACETSVENVQLLAPRGKHDLLFYKTHLRLKGGRQEQQVAYTRIQHVAIFDEIPKEAKKRVLLFLHLARDGQAKGKADSSNAIVIQLQPDASLDIPSPKAPAQRLTGPAAVVFCQAFGALGVPPAAFVAPAPDVFCAAGGGPAVEAVVGVNQGLLFPLPAALCFLQKPALWVDHSEVQSAELARAGGGSSTFDLQLILSSGAALEFANIDRGQLAALSSYLQRSRLRPAGEAGGGGDSAPEAGGGSGGEEDSSEEEDSDFCPRASSDSNGAAEAAAEASQSGGDSSGSSSSGDGSDVSVVSEDGVAASDIRQLVDAAKRPARKRRRS